MRGGDLCIEGDVDVDSGADRPPESGAAIFCKSRLFFCIYNATWACRVVQLIVGCKRYSELPALQVNV